jgi:hypothetical protein
MGWTEVGVWFALALVVAVAHKRAQPELTLNDIFNDMMCCALAYASFIYFLNV